MSDLSQDAKIDAICTRFERAWRAGERPLLEDYLADDVAREALLRELLAVEIFHRSRLGETPTLADYRERFPDLRPEWLDQISESAGETARLPDAKATPVAGTRVAYFGDYELLEEIGHGGMGVVWRAWQVRAGREVALKMIRAGEFASPEAVQRFRTEAETAASLDHPHIVSIYQVGEHDGQHYFSMKLIEGGSLKGQLGEVGLTPVLSQAEVRSRQATIAQMLVKIARAIHHAHERGVLHRDLKPANILLDDKGQPHVTDFGLAKRIEGDAGQTQTGQILGTPGYMAPEQARGDRMTTVRTDVYGLGAILYELLTGRPPFRAGTPLDTLELVRRGEPMSPRSINPQVDRDLEAVCLKCLNKDPAWRYATAQNLAEDLERYLRCESVGPRPPGFLDWLAQTLRNEPEPSMQYSWDVVFWQGLILFAQHTSVALLVSAEQPLWTVWTILVAGWGATGASLTVALGRFRQVPTTERHSSILGLGLFVATVALALTILPLNSQAPAQAVLPMYPPLALLYGLCGIVLGSTHWGRLLPLGFLIILLAPIMGAWPESGPTLMAFILPCWLFWWGFALWWSFLGRNARRG